MNIIVLGGAGDMGSQAVETLAHCPDVRQITIADKNVAGAEALARRLMVSPSTGCSAGSGRCTQRRGYRWRWGP